jgi:uncharacterized NAD(P)/FAD-binding protein YdhS
MRIAIVGGGPKGLFALERLLQHAAHLGSAAEVDVYEPHPVPGAGPVYDPAQPTWLRMNLAAAHVDAWCGDGLVPAAERRSFLEWSAGRHDVDDYVPRAEVGRYLADAFARVVAYAPEGVAVTVRPVRVDDVVAAGGGWAVIAAGGAARVYDEVLLAVGHPDLEAPATRDDDPSPVFPVSRLGAEAVPPGSVVAVLGFALTFIDAALALTEGRGGTFAPCDTRPGRLRYTASGREPAAILPHSRSGRPMHAKPRAAVFAHASLDAVADRGRAAILALPPGAGTEAIVAAVTTAARAALAVVGGDDDDGTGVGSPLDELARSVDVAAGTHAPDLDWARAHAWRTLYPAIVERCGAGGLPDDEWPGFLRLSTHMERIAFGPPLENAAKLLALVEAGAVDLAHVVGGRVVLRGARTVLVSAAGERPVDRTVDAVLAGPGVAGTGGIPARLVAAGVLGVRPGRRGLDVRADGRCVAPDGRPVPALAAIGRVTEDAVIGNDTLNRVLHPLADRWAAQVAGRAAARAGAAA